MMFWLLVFGGVGAGLILALHLTGGWIGLGLGCCAVLAADLVVYRKRF